MALGVSVFMEKAISGGAQGLLQPLCLEFAPSGTAGEPFGAWDITGVVHMQGWHFCFSFVFTSSGFLRVYFLAQYSGIIPDGGLGTLCSGHV